MIGQGVWILWGSKIAISHWQSQSPLTQGWRYRAARDIRRYPPGGLHLIITRIVSPTREQQRCTKRPSTSVTSISIQVQPINERVCDWGPYLWSGCSMYCNCSRRLYQWVAAVRRLTDGYLPSRRTSHWRRQLWGIGARAPSPPLEFQQFIFFCFTSELYKARRHTSTAIIKIGLFFILPERMKRVYRIFFRNEVYIWALFCAIICVWLKLFPRDFVPLVEPNPGDATVTRYRHLRVRKKYERKETDKKPSILQWLWTRRWTLSCNPCMLKPKK